MSPNTATKQRGVALITALLMAVIFLVLIGGLMAQMIGELQDVGTHSNSAIALNAAYAGVENMVLQIEENASGPGHATPAPISYTYPSPSHASYSATVATTWNTTGGLVYYQINSTGTETNSGQNRQVTALVRSFPYSYYEQFTAGNSGTVYYVTGETFDGPVYNGGTMNVWYQNPGASIFNNVVRTTVMPAFYQGAGKASVSYASVIWGDVTSTGNSTPLQIGAKPMSLPTFVNNLGVASEAFYGNDSHTSNLPTTSGKGLYIDGVSALTGSGNVTTGLYVEGNVKITPSSPGANNEVLTLAPCSGGGCAAAGSISQTYTVTVDFSANTTTVAQTTGCPCPSPVVYSGVLSGQAGVSGGHNGVIFVDGDVMLNSGTVHGQYSVVVPDYSTNHGHTITLDGHAPGVQYKDTSSTSTDEFGIWADDIAVNGANTSTGYTFDGDILTGYAGVAATDGTFSNNNYLGSPQGTFTFHGGLIQNKNGAMGISSGGVTVHGFDRRYQYDARLASNPPPGFPITNHYDIIAWLDEGI